MLQLRTFGSIDLQTSGGTTAGLLLAQPRSAALFIYLLLAHPRGFQRRDVLCALFWPDSDDEHARGALSQALTRIRKSCHEATLELRGKDEIRVLPGAVECDVLHFEAAIAAGDHGAALELYAGPFLAGFHAPHMPGFERWAEEERDRLRSLAADAARSLANKQIAAGQLHDAEQAAARALALAPESEAAASELISALAAAGDRAGALGLYETWAALLARDFELQPSENLQAVAQEIRALASGPLRDVTAAADTFTPVRAASTSQARPPWWRRRKVVFGLAAAMALLLSGWGLVQAGLLETKFPVKASGRVASGLTGKDWLIVADFDGPSSDPALALAFQTLLIRDLESVGYASVVGGAGALSRRALDDVLARMRLPAGTRIDAELACEIAEREGAAGVLAGRVLPLGNDYVFAATILRVERCEELIRASAVASFDELSRAVVAVSHELRLRLGESKASVQSSPPLPPMTTAYIEALRAASRYINTPELWDDEVAGAAPLLEAIRIEPSFAFAHFLLALHYQRFGRYAEALPHVLEAYQLRSQLPRAGRLGMEAIYQRYIASDPRAAMRTVQQVIADFPALADATMPFLTEAALWAGEWQRALDVSLVYLGRRPSGLGAHLGYLYGSAAAAALGQAKLADSLYQIVAHMQASAGRPPEPTLLLLPHLRRRDWIAAEALCAQHPAWELCGYIYLTRGRLRAAGKVFDSALADAANQPAWRRAAAVAARTQLDLVRGRPDSAWQMLLRADRTIAKNGVARAGMHLKRFLLCAAATEVHRSSQLPECRIEEEDRAKWDADPSFTVMLRSGAWSHRLLALRSLERGNAAAALEQARDAVRSNFGNATAIDHLVHARAFDALARRDSAITHYVAATQLERDYSFPTAAGISLPLAPIYRRIGELAEETGDVPTALRYYDAFTSLWSQADPELRPQVVAVRERMRQLRAPT